MRCVCVVCVFYLCAHQHTHTHTLSISFSRAIHSFINSLKHFSLFENYFELQFSYDCLLLLYMGNGCTNLFSHFDNYNQHYDKQQRQQRKKIIIIIIAMNEFVYRRAACVCLGSALKCAAYYSNRRWMNAKKCFFFVLLNAKMLIRHSIARSIGMHSQKSVQCQILEVCVWHTYTHIWRLCIDGWYVTLCISYKSHI